MSSESGVQRPAAKNAGAARADAACCRFTTEEVYPSEPGREPTPPPQNVGSWATDARSSPITKPLGYILI
jgi:hypothetical protein